MAYSYQIAKSLYFGPVISHCLKARINVCLGAPSSQANLRRSSMDIIRNERHFPVIEILQIGLQPLLHNVLNQLQLQNGINTECHHIGL